MVFLQNVWWYLVLIGVMILIHELGHYWAARFFDVRIEAFSFGFGPRLFGFRRGETDFRFSAILFGGYVKMAGEQPGEEIGDDPRAFLSKPRWQRVIIAAAGPIINILLAIALLAGLFMYSFPKLPTKHSPMVAYLTPDGAAAKAGIKEGDRILEIDGKVDPDWEDVQMKEIAAASKSILVVVQRNGERLSIPVTPVLDEKRGGIGWLGWMEEADIEIAAVGQGKPADLAGLKRGDLFVDVNGVSIRSTHKVNEVIRAAEGKPVTIHYLRDGKPLTTTVAALKEPVEGQERWMIGIALEPHVIMTQLSMVGAVRESVRQNMNNATLIYKFLEGIAERRMSPKSLEGPIRIAKLSGDAARAGAGPFFGLMAMVSLNLAIFNLLPIPILDGGVILLLLVEMIMRRDLSMRVKEAVVRVGFVFLMVIVVFVLYNDLSKVLPAG